jgi:hypothetical protein
MKVIYKVLEFICFVFLLSSCISTQSFSDIGVDSPTSPTVENSCQTIKLDSKSKPAFKGMELYSWQKGNGDWVYNILYGTNRLKTINEVMSSEMGSNAVSDCICSMSDREVIFWMNKAQDETTNEMQPLPLPPIDMINGITAIADHCGVKLIIP